MNTSKKVAAKMSSFERPTNFNKSDLNTFFFYLICDILSSEIDSDQKHDPYLLHSLNKSDFDTALQVEYLVLLW